MALLPQDILVALQLAVYKDKISYAELGDKLGLSASQAHAAVKRGQKAGFLHPKTRRAKTAALLEFLLHGLKYMLPPERGPITRGMPTSHSAPPLREHIVQDGVPIVWPTEEGEVRGEALEPLYKTAPRAARSDPRLYAALALVDAVRSGRARERRLAETMLRELLEKAPEDARSEH